MGFYKHSGGLINWCVHIYIYMESLSELIVKYKAFFYQPYITQRSKLNEYLEKKGEDKVKDEDRVFYFEYDYNDQYKP